MKYISRATSILLFAIVVLIPFSVRYVLDFTRNYQTGAYSDFTSFSIYLSDIVLLLLIACFMWNKKKERWISSLPKSWLYIAALSLVWLRLELFFQSSTSYNLELYFSARFALLIVFAVIVSQIKVSREKIALLFTILGLLQSVIATVQFYWQKSIGLYYLGESHLSPDTLGVAKIVSHGTKMIRGYGTFPHANLLSAFLVIATLFNLYLIIKYYQIPRDKRISHGTIKQICLYTALGMNTFGVFISFSRAGILALAIGLTTTSLILLINKQYLAMKQVIAMIVAILISLAILWSPLSTRATFSDSATKERAFYNQIGKEIVINKPIFGTGPGTSVLHMKQYASSLGKGELQPWEIQPIHNYYLISLAEWGIGSILLLGTIILPIFFLFKRKFKIFTIWQVFLASIALSILALFLFDHYFYTIWPTQLLLWLIIGLILREIVEKSTTYDTTFQQ